MQGGNLKTQWRLEFSGLATVEQRRRRALDRALLESYEAYQWAFHVDLNNVYPGISALQTGMILQNLSYQDGWPRLFGRDKVKAQRFREDLETQLVSLRYVVAASVESVDRALSRAVGEGLMWAHISEADLLFLTSEIGAGQDDTEAVAAAYRDAIPKGKAFAWDATRGQLMLFAALGIKAGLAKKIVRGMDARFESAKPLHLVVFSGLTVDAPHAVPPRFPATMPTETKARDIIRDRLDGLRRRDEELVVLASATPGADILMHEVCANLGVKSVLCLPVPATVVARELFKDHHTWLARFLAVVRAHDSKDTLALRTEPYAGQLPRWRRRGTSDVWDRGHRWIIKNAEAWDADQKTMMALWDGAPDAAAASGGTARMVKLAQQSGLFDIKIIDSKGSLSPET